MYYELAELHADLLSRHASFFRCFVFLEVDEKYEDFMSDEICRRRHGISKEGCMAAEACSSKSGFCSLFFQTFMHIYVLYDQIYLAKIKQENTPRLRSRDGHVEHFCKTSGSISQKLRGYLEFCA